MQSFSESRGESKVIKSVLSNSTKRYRSSGIGGAVVTILKDRKQRKSCNGSGYGSNGSDTRGVRINLTVYWHEVWDRETVFSQLAKRSPYVVVSG